ncbi:MAG: hypothetical protein PHQ14_01155 [Chromatiales bacterium]|nr:hypothetical protein [Chromatiales bacterium]MDX9766070.1 hypothetical protein [Ectothiorhodospiraceae bacterium]
MGKARRSRSLTLDAARLRTFERDAPAALARRTPAFFAEQYWAVAELLLVAGVSLWGLFVLGWSPVVMLVYLLAGIWLGTFVDALKLWLIPQAVRRETAAFNRDRMVWVVVDALMHERDEISDNHAAGYRPRLSLGIDILFGGFATLMILAPLVEARVDIVAELLADRTMLNSLAFTLALQFAGGVWIIASHRIGPERDAPTRIGLGARGLGLFLLMFLFVIVGPGPDVAWRFLLPANLALIALAGLSAFGVVLMHRETIWLRGHLRARSAAPVRP